MQVQRLRAQVQAAAEQKHGKNAESERTYVARLVGSIVGRVVSSHEVEKKWAAELQVLRQRLERAAVMANMVKDIQEQEKARQARVSPNFFQEQRDWQSYTPLWKNDALKITVCLRQEEKVVILLVRRREGRGIVISTLTFELYMINWHSHLSVLLYCRGPTFNACKALHCISSACLVEGMPCLGIELCWDLLLSRNLGTSASIVSFQLP